MLPVVCWFKGIGTTSDLDYTVLPPRSNDLAVQVFLHKIDKIDTSLAEFQGIFNTTIALMNNFSSDALREIRSFLDQNACAIRVISTTDGVLRSEKQALDLSMQMRRQANRLDYMLVTSRIWLVNLDALEGDLALVSDIVLAEEELISEAKAIRADFFGFVFSGGSEHLKDTLDEMSKALAALMQWHENTSSLVCLLTRLLCGLGDNLVVAEELYYDVVMRGYMRDARIIKLQDTLVLIENSLQSLAIALVSSQE
ncbi:hypothetical protein GYMLUDRAFT_244224 [Collybiopsis luxurians FD-317 M1]|uniref:Uncharacterized protein n=1 Tax=Collybiopsis luxurians FD-317 M1 TaxID=944289 RepID=A0A0D0CP85_9AGAR|nr:hypothetical protein GYMLUDRAFT_244224 [Collybiopsis luxurians FD-317 M1]